MKANFFVLPVLSVLSTVLAGPIAEPDSSTLSVRKNCPGLVEGYYLGECNGTSCHWHGIDLECEKGKCTGNGGGDGSCCHVKDQVTCPNGGFN